MSENDSPRLYLRNAKLNTNFRTHDILQLTNKIQSQAQDTMDSNIKWLCDSESLQMKDKPQHQSTPPIRLKPLSTFANQPRVSWPWASNCLIGELCERLRVFRLTWARQKKGFLEATCLKTTAQDYIYEVPKWTQTFAHMTSCNWQTKYRLQPWIPWIQISKAYAIQKCNRWSTNRNIRPLQPFV